MIAQYQGLTRLEIERFRRRIAIGMNDKPHRNQKHPP
jgi:hypothetical protein